MLTFFTSPASLLARPSSLHWAAICPTTLVAAGRGPDTAPHGVRALHQPTVSTLPKPPPIRKLPSCMPRSKGISRVSQLCNFLFRRKAVQAEVKWSAVVAVKGTRAARAQVSALRVTELVDRVLVRPRRGVRFAEEVKVKRISRCGRMMDWDRHYDRRSLPYFVPLRGSSS